MNHSLHTNYQTSFRILRKDNQTYFEAIRAVFNWLCTKEKEKSLQYGWQQFSFKGEWDHCYQSNARIQTNTCIEADDQRSWAFEYSHVDKQLGAKRFWHTFVGIRDTGDALIVAAKVAYSWNNEDLSIAPPAPSPSVPYFIRLLIKNFTAYSGRKEFRLIEKPLLLKAVGSGVLVRDFIIAPERRYPLIVFNGDSEVHLREANHLSTSLTGKAQVVVLGSDPTLGREVKAAFPKDYNIGYETVRVFFPMGFGPQSPKRHRWFDVRSNEYENQRAGIIHGLLRNHNLVESNTIESLSDVQRLIFKAKITKLKESTEGASTDEIHALYQNYIKEIEEQRDKAKNEAEHYAQEIDQLESELRSVEWKSKALEQTPTVDSINTRARELFFKLPETLPDVVRAASVIHSDRLIFAQEAFDSAEENSSCELVTDAWHIISHLATTLHDLRFGSDSAGDIAKQFQDKSGYEYAKTEGKQTKADAKLKRQRKITHDGKDYEIWAHIKKGNEGTKQIRIYFDYDSVEKKILVGYVGLHMDNASTRGRK